MFVEFEIINMTPHDILFLLFVLLQLGDIYTTVNILKRGGVEYNPVIAKLMYGIGRLNGLLAIKIPIILLVVVTTLYGFIPFWLLSVMCMAYIVVVGHNLYKLLKLK